MIKWLSKSGIFFQASLFFVAGALLWIPAFMHPAPAITSPGDGPLYAAMASLFSFSATLSVSAAALLVLIASFFIFYIFHVHQFFGRSNFVPAIIALMAFSWNPNYNTLHAMLPASLLVIIAVHSMLMMYGQQAAYKNVFTASFAIGLASLFYTPLIFLLLMIWFTLITYRVSSWHEYVISLLGLLAPYIYYVSGLFWNDNLLWGWQSWYHSLLHATPGGSVPVYFTVWLIVSAAVLLFTLFTVLNVMGDRVISLRRKSWLMFNLVAAMAPAMLLCGRPYLHLNYIFIIPLVFALSGSIFVLKKPFRFEIFALAYLVAFILFRLIYFVAW